MLLRLVVLSAIVTAIARAAPTDWSTQRQAQLASFGATAGKQAECGRLGSQALVPPVVSSDGQWFAVAETTYQSEQLMVTAVSFGVVGNASSGGWCSK